MITDNINNTYVKIYSILLNAIILEYKYDEEYIKDINHINTFYLMKFKNLIIETHTISKLVDILIKKMNDKISAKNGNKKILFSDGEKKTICPITMDKIVSKFFYKCGECKTTYTIDGLEFLQEHQIHCGVSWCNNSIDNFKLICDTSSYKSISNDLYKDINIELINKIMNLEFLSKFCSKNYF